MEIQECAITCNQETGCRRESVGVVGVVWEGNVRGSASVGGSPFGHSLLQFLITLHSQLVMKFHSSLLIRALCV